MNRAGFFVIGLVGEGSRGEPLLSEKKEGGEIGNVLRWERRGGEK